VKDTGKKNCKIGGSGILQREKTGKNIANREKWRKEQLISSLVSTRRGFGYRYLAYSATLKEINEKNGKILLLHKIFLFSIIWLRKGRIPVPAKN
jgi:hypothetical protein